MLIYCKASVKYPEITAQVPKVTSKFALKSFKEHYTLTLTEDLPQTKHGWLENVQTNWRMKKDAWQDMNMEATAYMFNQTLVKDSLQESHCIFNTNFKYVERMIF